MREIGRVWFLLAKGRAVEQETVEMINSMDEDTYLKFVTYVLNNKIYHIDRQVVKNFLKEVEK